MKIIRHSNPPVVEKVDLPPLSPSQIKKGILIALATIMAIGMILSYFLGAPWLVILGFFALALCALYPLEMTVDEQRARILE